MRQRRNINTLTDRDLELVHGGAGSLRLVKPGFAKLPRAQAKTDQIFLRLVFSKPGLRP